jgi:chaperonin GroEL (HSP60 family)
MTKLQERLAKLAGVAVLYVGASEVEMKEKKTELMMMHCNARSCRRRYCCWGWCRSTKS